MSKRANALENEISLKCFLNTFEESCKNDGRYCFILGAGASKAGISTGIEMAQIWSNELKDRYNDHELKELMEKLNIKDISVSGKNYFNIYDLRFYPDYSNGYSYIAKIMENAKPSYGYYPLAMQIASTKNNLVITTNFDTMVEDALFIYTNKRPIVAGHESLASYIDINTDRPIIAKIHRSLYFNPLNRPKELACLSDEWKGVLKKAFQNYTPIVIGYSGGDNDLMDFLKDKFVEMKRLYWCYYKKDVLSDEIVNLVQSKNGFFVPIDGFDSMMFSLSQKFTYEDPCGKIAETTNERIKMYREKYEEFSNKAKAVANPDNEETEVIDMLIASNQKMIELNLKRISENSKDKDAYLDLAYQYELNKEYTSAIECYSRAIDLQADANTYIRRGDAFIQIKEYNKAIVDYTKAIELKSDHAGAYNNRGNAYYDSGEYDKALSDYNQAIKLRPEYAGAYSNRGLSYRRLNEYDKALSDFIRAIELNPELAEAYYNRGITYDDMKEYDKVLEDYTRAIELKPDYAIVYNNRGYLHYQMGEYEKAFEDLNRSIELDPNNYYAYDSRGCVYTGIKEYDKAILDFSKAIELNTNLIETYKNRAEAYLALGENEKAKADLEKAEALSS